MGPGDGLLDAIMDEIPNLYTYRSSPGSQSVLVLPHHAHPRQVRVTAPRPVDND